MHLLDILGGLNTLVPGIHFPARKRVACDAIKYPPFPPAVKALAVLAYARYIRLAYDGGLHGEER